MGRAQLYYPANQLSEVRIAEPGEFIETISLEEYVGPYVEANGQYIAGSNPRLGDPVLKRIADIAGEKFRQPISSEYYTLTRREFDNHHQPVHVKPTPTIEDYEDGVFLRFFAQKKNELNKIYELDEEQYNTFNQENSVGIDSSLYHKIELKWMLTGKDAIQNNKINISLLESRYPGIQVYFSTPAEHVRYNSTKNKTYSDGKIISDNLPPAYAKASSEQACMNCKFRHNNYCSKWVAQIRTDYWCASWKQKTIRN